MAKLDDQDRMWTLDHICKHIEHGLPLVALFNIAVIEASPERRAVRQGAAVTRPCGGVAGPVPFALADLGSYALILAARRDGAAVTVDLTIDFLRGWPAEPLPASRQALHLGV